VEVFDINASLRDVQGKGASRRLRRAGQVPGVVYGGGKDPVNIQFQHNDLYLHTQHEAFYSHILNLVVDGDSQRVILRDMQRHPFKPSISHIDFQRVNESEALTMNIPLHFINEEECVGVKTGGGIISHLMTELEISCLPKDLPEYIEVDVLELEIGSAIHLSDLKIPRGVEIAALMHGGDDAQPVVSVHAPRVEVEIEEGAPEAPEVEANAAEGDAGDGE